MLAPGLSNRTLNNCTLTGITWLMMVEGLSAARSNTAPYDNGCGVDGGGAINSTLNNCMFRGTELSLVAGLPAARSITAL